MRPILFKCGIFTIYTYGVFIAIGFLAATTFLLSQARKRGLKEDLFYNLCICLLLSGIVGARIFYVVLNWDFFKDNLVEVFMLNHGGLVWFGGLFGALLCGLYYMKVKGLAFLQTFDLLVPAVALAQAIGRIGCFFNGCCYGKESSFGIYFPSQGKTLFPSQILDAMTLFFVFIVLRRLAEKGKKGETFSFYLILSGAQRFLMEFVRGDVRPFYFHLSIFQWISMGLSLAGLVVYLKVVVWMKKSA
jgi:phosphatidylglycerol:prolipoprotein diacylglycerol transferase